MSVSNALVDVVLDEVRERPRSRLRGLLEWFTEMAKPPLGVRLVSDDGGTFSGVVVVEDSRPILMLAFRTGGTDARERLAHPRHALHLDDEEWAPPPDATFE
jgi:hypothetical protein